MAHGHLAGGSGCTPTPAGTLGAPRSTAAAHGTLSLLGALRPGRCPCDPRTHPTPPAPCVLPPLLGTHRHQEPPRAHQAHQGVPGDPTLLPTQGQWDSGGDALGARVRVRVPPVPPVPSMSPAPPGTCPPPPCQPSLGDLEPPRWQLPRCQGGVGTGQGGPSRGTHPGSTQVPAVAGGVSACTELLPDSAPTPCRVRRVPHTPPAPPPRGMRVPWVIPVLCRGGRGC